MINLERYHRDQMYDDTNDDYYALFDEGQQQYAALFNKLDADTSYLGNADKRCSIRIVIEFTTIALLSLVNTTL